MTHSEIKRLNGGGLKRSRSFGGKRTAGEGKFPDGNRFKFKNSLIITPNLEAEFSESGGIKYIKNHANTVFMVGGGTYVVNNGIDKLPVLLSRGINKQSNQKKLIIEEKYNFEEKYDISQNIVLYFEENRVDFQILFNRKKYKDNPKTVINSFRFDFFTPDLPFSAGSEATLQKPSELLFGGGDGVMTVIPDKTDSAKVREKLVSLLCFNRGEGKVYLNFKVFFGSRR